jgi:hypothetical protein
MSKYIVFCLGRYGDICNALPIAWDVWQTTGERPQFMVAASHADILDGVSYVVPKIWPGRCDEHQEALASLRPEDGQVINAMIFRHVEYNGNYQTDSYQKESWRVAGYLEKFGTLPLVFDKRSSGREAALTWMRITEGPVDSASLFHKPIILVSVGGISSPFSKGEELKERIRSKIHTHNIVDLSKTEAFQIFDIIGLMDESYCLVATDSVFLHLAQASKVPIVALINNGWCGSVPPQRTKAVFRYKDALANLDAVVKAVEDTL